MQYKKHVKWLKVITFIKQTCISSCIFPMTCVGEVHDHLTEYKSSPSQYSNFIKFVISFLHIKSMVQNSCLVFHRNGSWRNYCHDNYSKKYLSGSRWCMVCHQFNIINSVCNWYYTFQVVYDIPRLLKSNGFI